MFRQLSAAILGAGMLLVSLQECSGDDAEAKADAKRDYRALVAELASPNNEPTTFKRAGGRVKFPARYNVKAQRRIDEVRRILQDNIEESLPFLVEALDDKRYCMTIDWGDGDAYYNRSVGSICQNVIESHLEIYRDKIGFSGPQHWKKYTYPISKEWWQARKDRSLVELQIEAVDWAIELRKVDDMEARTDPAKELADLRKLRDEVESSQKPAKPRHMFRMETTNQ
jgi:hypothetical protein